MIIEGKRKIKWSGKAHRIRGQLACAHQTPRSIGSIASARTKQQNKASKKAP
jgi:hypothetical protein